MPNVRHAGMKWGAPLALWIAAWGALTFNAVMPSQKGGGGRTDMPEKYKKERTRMVQEQIIRRGVKNPRVIEAILKVPRHRFVPVELRPNAYDDDPLPIGCGQTISQPYIVAYMTEVLDLKGNEKVLEVGTGSGYQAAVLAEVAREVYTIEILKPLADQAKKILDELGYKNIHFSCGDGYQGWPAEAPFDAIIVTAAPSEIPESLVRQLKDQGRMILPVGDLLQELVLITRKNGLTTTKSLIPVRFVPMTGKARPSD